MATINSYVYWDSCVFLDYFSATPGRIETIDPLLQEISRAPDRKLITSSIVITEVAHVLDRQKMQLVPADEEKIDQLWRAQFVELVDVTSFLLYRARALMRSAVNTRRVTLKPNDALHLATAQWVNEEIGVVSEVHTYDTKLYQFSTLIGIPICAPYISQPPLPMDPHSSW